MSMCKYCGAPLGADNANCINDCQDIWKEEPTIVEAKLAPCVELKRKPTPGLKQLLNDLVDLVEKGEVIGITFLCNKGNSTVVYYAGVQELGDQLMAFEDYKFRVMIDRNVANPPPMKKQD